MRVTKREVEELTAYVEERAGETIVHAEKAASKLVASARYDIWDVHCASSHRWWVITNPMNLYSQTDFKSREVALTFHIRVAVSSSAKTTIRITAR
jgi:hypothetical protein